MLEHCDTHMPALSRGERPIAIVSTLSSKIAAEVQKLGQKNDRQDQNEDRHILQEENESSSPAPGVKHSPVAQRKSNDKPYSDRCERYCCSGVHFRLPGHRTIRSSSAATGISISSTIDQKPRKGNKAAAKPLWFSLSLIFWPCPGKFRSLQIRNRSELTNSSDASRVAFGALYFLWQVPNRQDRRNRSCQFCQLAETVLNPSIRRTLPVVRNIFATNQGARIALQIIGQIVNRARGVGEFVERGIQLVDHRRARTQQKLSRSEAGPRLPKRGLQIHRG